MLRVVSRAVAARWLSTGASKPLSAAEVKGWSSARVVEFVKSIGLDDDDAKVLSANKVDGKRLLNLTEDKLCADGMPRGPASDLAIAIAGLRDKGELLAGTWRCFVRGFCPSLLARPRPTPRSPRSLSPPALRRGDRHADLQEQGRQPIPRNLYA